MSTCTYPCTCTCTCCTCCTCSDFSVPPSVCSIQVKSPESKTVDLEEDRLERVKDTSREELQV